MKTFYFKVAMSCGGCSRAIKNALEKNKDKVESFTVSLEDKIVAVTAGDDDYEIVKSILTKTGKTTEDAKQEEIEAFISKQKAAEEKAAEEKAAEEKAAEEKQE
ncbi:Cytosolic copper metallochaperone [Coemansia spiralis]|uniref:Cytosolic copper metallochaperone n=2 Tax=Coemansia TaxID=4863 RepID=A0A9W8G911_9FUNG|nr:Cytosolic copper metallochaperone [Coemansia umbellata]KAJ2622043.1 Cytosolic copper metallochaperone [Coemansia sp. RSA 1358]KAJ2677647.1 Cytosolic copper metallochaperone [Coemansia spiralis]